jgi:hypothetical protein
MKHIRALPYHEMLELAKHVEKELRRAREEKEAGDVLAKVLSRAAVAFDPSSISEAVKNEEKMFRRAFARKRSIAIESKSNGWEVHCSTLPGSQVIGTELRPLFPQMLDQIITLEALGLRK